MEVCKVRQETHTEPYLGFNVILQQRGNSRGMRDIQVRKGLEILVALPGFLKQLLCCSFGMAEPDRLEAVLGFSRQSDTHCR